MFLLETGFSSLGIVENMNGSIPKFWTAYIEIEKPSQLGTQMKNIFKRQVIANSINMTQKLNQGMKIMFGAPRSQSSRLQTKTNSLKFS